MTTHTTATPASAAFSQALASAHDQIGQTLADLSHTAPTLVVFLRHAGCTFCREALADLAKIRTAIEAEGVQICLVHMGSDDHAAEFFAAYGMDDVPRISDPGQGLYRAFDLGRGKLRQLFGPKVIVRGAEAAANGHGIGRLIGDGFQMPGVFLIRDGQIVRAFRHQTAADRPDYAALACPLPPGSTNG